MEKPMSRGSRKAAAMSGGGRKPAAKKSSAAPSRGGAKDMNAKLRELRKENRELKSQLGKGKTSTKDDKSGPKESMKERMAKLRSMRKKK